MHKWPRVHQSLTNVSVRKEKGKIEQEMERWREIQISMQRQRHRALRRDRDTRKETVIGRETKTVRNWGRWQHQ